MEKQKPTVLLKHAVNQSRIFHKLVFSYAKVKIRLRLTKSFKLVMNYARKWWMTLI
jgi:hypothetical protein